MTQEWSNAGMEVGPITRAEKAEKLLELASARIHELEMQLGACRRNREIAEAALRGQKIEEGLR